MSIHLHEHFQPIAAQYDAFILDLWGVIHDGAETYPQARETLQALKAANKRVMFLSNAPRRAHKVKDVLERLGVTADLYEHIVCSGEAAFHTLSQWKPMPYYFIGPDRDAGIADGLAHRRVTSMDDAEIILCAGYDYDGQPIGELEPALQRAMARNLPFFCLNPDMEVVKLNGERLLCAGVIAERYEDLGGGVAYFGKPYNEVYATCLQALGDVPRERIICVGDGLFTDIAGAENAGLDSVLVIGGILQNEMKETFGSNSFKEHLRAYCDQQGIVPTYAIPHFMW